MSEWISVEERMPEEWVEVLVFVPGIGREIAWLCKPKGFWRWVYSGDIIELDVTHWMPLPSPPGEEGE